MAQALIEKTHPAGPPYLHLCEQLMTGQLREGARKYFAETLLRVLCVGQEQHVLALGKRQRPNGLRERQPAAHSSLTA